MSESGLAELKNYDVTYWVGIMAPTGTPPAVIRAINAETNTWIETTDAKEKLQTMCNDFSLELGRVGALRLSGLLCRY